MSEMILCENLVKIYKTRETEVVALQGLDMTVDKGELMAIIGNSGSGKTTLGKMLVGSILPTSGNVRLDLMDLRNWDQRQFGESIGYLPQDVQLFPGTIKANICRMRDDVEDRQIYEAAVLGLIGWEGNRPKIVASTATIRSAPEQVRRLYGSPVALFPPSGLEADDSYFARTDEDAPGRLLPRAAGPRSPPSTGHPPP